MVLTSGGAGDPSSVDPSIHFAASTLESIGTTKILSTGTYGSRALAFHTGTDGAGTERVRINSDGKFIVKGVGTEAFSVDGGAPNNSLIVDSSGRCLVGTPTPESGNERFVVKGNPGGDYIASFVASNPSVNPFGVWIKYSALSPNDTSARFLTCADATATRAEIRSNGGLANYQSNNVDLSDARSKRNIAPASDFWDCVQAWEVVNYNYIDDVADEAARIGVIAQQVQQHCPEVVIPYQEAEDAILDDDGNVVTPAKEERLGVREQQMMWMAIKALQEAQTRIETLEAKVAALEAQ